MSLSWFIVGDIFNLKNVAEILNMNEPREFIFKKLDWSAQITHNFIPKEKEVINSFNKIYKY